LEFSFISMFRWRVRDRISVGGGRLFGLATMAAQKIKDDLFVLSGQGCHHHLLVLTAHEVDAGFFRQSEDVAPGVSIAWATSCSIPAAAAVTSCAPAPDRTFAFSACSSNARKSAAIDGASRFFPLGFPL
jgi:hypothetical protein